MLIVVECSSHKSNTSNRLNIRMSSVALNWGITELACLACFFVLSHHHNAFVRFQVALIRAAELRFWYSTLFLCVVPTSVIQFALWFKHQQRCGLFRDLHCCQSYRCDCWSDGYGDLVAILCVGFVLMLFRCFGDWCCFLLRCERWGCCRFTAAWWCCRFHSSLMNIALLCHCILSVSVICLFFSAYVCFRSYLSARVGECWLYGSVAALMFASAAPASLLAAAILCNCNMVQCLHCLSVLSFCLW